jgi:hypothetical protein
MAAQTPRGVLAAGALFASAGGEAQAATSDRTNAIETAVKNRVIEEIELIGEYMEHIGGYIEYIGCGKRELRGAV